MSSLSTAYAISEVIPFLQRWLNGDNIIENANKITQIAQKITGEKTSIEIIRVLNTDMGKMVELQSALLEMIDELDANSVKSIPSISRLSCTSGIMVVSVSVALCVYIYALTCFNDNLSREVLGILSTIAGIFGSCLKDAFSAEFKFQKDKEGE